MKLIIDIDDEMVCNDIKNKALEPTSETDEVIINALYNGTPYNPTGDLISREALKEDFKSRLADCNDWIENAKDKETKIRASAVKTFIAEVILTINNAPTVEYTFEEAFQKTVCDNKLYCPARPQGGRVVPDTLQGWRYEERPKGGANMGDED